MTTEQKHTKGPWKFVQGDVCYKSDRDDQTFGFWCPITQLHAAENWEANARRIVACVNACENIPTDHLENFGLPQLAALAAKVKELEKDVEHYRSAYKAAHNQAMTNGQRARELDAQRDELLDDLYHFLEGFNLSGHARKRLEEIYWSMEAKIEAEKQNEAIK